MEQGFLADCCIDTRLGITNSSVSELFAISAGRVTSSIRRSSAFVGRSLVVELVPNLAINGIKVN